MSDDIRELVGNKKLHGKIVSAEEAAKIVEAGMTLGCSGFTPSGYPKTVPTALAKRAEANGPIPISIWTGASTGPELDGELSRTGCIKKRYPYQTNEEIRKGINSGAIQFADIHLSHCAQNIRYGFYGKIDIAIIEALRITD